MPPSSNTPPFVPQQPAPAPAPVPMQPPKKKWPWWVKTLIFIAVIVVVLIALYWASIVVVSLNAARGNEPVVSNVQAAQTAANAAATGGDYSGVCNNDTVKSDLAAAAQAGTGDPTQGGCYATKTTYILVAALKSGGLYCVDSTGNSEVVDDFGGTAILCKDLPAHQSTQ
ncbi:MAG: hypothetical protein KGI70_03250 [Patescibacteria group bacterium]|nr:hypothetical protein [Patescibacteria group bacterium]